MKDFRSLIKDVVNNRDRRRKQLSAVISMSVLISFAVPMVLTEPASSMTFADIPADVISTQLMNVSANAVGNVDGKDGNLYDGKYLSPAEVSEVELLMGNRDWVVGCNDANSVSIVARNKYFLGVASDFCVFLENDFNPQACDAEGRVAVGGNLEFGTKDGQYNYLVGEGDFGNKVALSSTSDYKEITGFAHLITNGTIKKIATFGEKGTIEQRAKRLFVNGFDDTCVHWGVNEDGEGWGSDKKYKNNCKHDNINGYNDKHVDELKQIYKYDDSSKQLINFESEFNYMRKQSQALAKIKGTPATEKNGTVIFDAGEGCNAETVYFELDSKYLNGEYKFEFKNIPKVGGTVKSEVDLSKHEGYKEMIGNTTEYPAIANIVINVKGDNINIRRNENTLETKINDFLVSNIGGGEGWTNNHPYSSNILYNFVDYNSDDKTGKEFNINTNFNGTILALNADVKANEGTKGHLSGALIAKSYEGDMEFGYRPYRGPASIISSSVGYGVPIKKVINDTAKTPLANATFGIYDGNDLVGSFTSDGDGNGYANIPSAIDFSKEDYALNKQIPKTYIIKETDAPTGFILDNSQQYVVDVTETINNIETIDGKSIPTEVTTTMTSKTQTKNNDGNWVDGASETFKIELKDFYSYDASKNSSARVRRELKISQGVVSVEETFYMDIDNDGNVSVSKQDETKKSDVTGAIIVTNNVTTSTETEVLTTKYVTVYEDDGKTPQTVTNTIYEDIPTYTLDKMAWNHLANGVSNVKIKEMTVFYLNDNKGTFKTYTGNFTNGTASNNDYWGQISLPDMVKENIVGIKFKFEKIDVNGAGNGKLVMQGEWNSEKNQNEPFFTEYDKGIVEFSEIPEDGIIEKGYIPSSYEVETSEEETEKSEKEAEEVVELAKTEETEETEESEESKAEEIVTTKASSGTFTTTTRTETSVVTSKIPDAKTSITSYYTTTSVSNYDVYAALPPTVSGSNTTYTTTVDDKSRTYKYDEENIMLMPIPSNSPTFKNDYGLIFEKVDEKVEPVKDAKIAIDKWTYHSESHNWKWDNITEDILYGDSSTTINLNLIQDYKYVSNAEHLVVYRFVETYTPKYYETADPIYFIVDKDTNKVYYNTTFVEHPFKESDFKVSNFNSDKTWKTIDLTNNKENPDNNAIRMIDNNEITGVQIKLEKIDSETGAKLNGATFKLYAKNGEDGDLVYPLGEDETFTIIDTVSFDLYNTLKNANSGEYNAEYVNRGYLTPGIYYLNEITPPGGGYDIQERFYFKVTSSSIEPVDANAPLYFDTIIEGNQSVAVFIYPKNADGNKITVSNVTKIEIELNKPTSGNLELWEGPFSGKILTVTDGKAVLDNLDNVSFERFKIHNNSNYNAGVDVKAVRIYGEASESSDSSGSSSDNGTGLTMEVNSDNNGTVTVSGALLAAAKKYPEADFIELNRKDGGQIHILTNSNTDINMGQIAGNIDKTRYSLNDILSLAKNAKKASDINEITTVRFMEWNGALTGTALLKVDVPTAPVTPETPEETADLTVRVDGGTIKIPNKKSDNPTGKITVEKKWEDDTEFKSLRPDSITVTLKRQKYDADTEKYVEDTDFDIDTEITKTATIKADKDGNWKYTFENLEKGTDAENPYKYYVEEAAVKNYNSVISEAVATEGTITITNTLNTIDINVNKTWKYKDGTDIDKTNNNSLPEIKVQVKYRTVGSTDENAWTELKNKEITLSKANNWTAELKKLPEAYEYKFTEAVPVSWECISLENELKANKDKKTVELVNKANGIELPSAGGKGTTNYYIFGALIMSMSGVILLIRRRRTAK